MARVIASIFILSLASKLSGYIPILYEPSAHFYQIPMETTTKFVINVYIPPKKLIFFKKDGRFVNEFEIRLEVKNKDKPLLSDFWDYRVFKDTYNETQMDTPKINKNLQITLDRYPEYEFSLSVEDINSNQELLKEEKKIKRHELPISDIIPLDPEAYKRGMKNIIEPVEIDIKELVIFWESHSKERKRLSLMWRIEDRYNGKTLLKGTKSTLLDTIYEDTLSVNIEDLESGEYKFIARFLKEGKVFSRTLEFSVFDITRLSDEDFGEMVDILSYIAEYEELEELKSLPKEDRGKALEEFWKKKDPTPGTPENELKDEYIRRIRYANENFSVGNKPGYKTDRGMIYIKYGPPDYIEQYPYEVNTRPYEIWYYYSENIKFVFVDRIGVGDYELVYPPYTGY